MTWALCLNCGATKFGALCPCPECQVNSTGDMSLDINFSDHRLSWSTLEAFGAVVRSIRQVCDDDQERFWAFIYFVSVHHPEVLGVKMPEDEQQRYAALLAQAKPLAVVVEESERGRFMRELQKGSAEPGAG